MKGTKTYVVKKEIGTSIKNRRFSARKQFSHEMNMLRNEGHEIYRVLENKISLSPFDSKRFIAENGIDTFAYGYRLKYADQSLILMLGIR